MKHRKDAPATREEYEKGLLKLLTPAGEKFSTRLLRVLDEECEALYNNTGAEAIRKAVLANHLKSAESVRAVNQLAASRTRPRITCYYLFMNYANILIASGDHHEARGRLDRLGQKLFEIWHLYARRLVEAGEVEREQIDVEEKKLLETIAAKGKTFSMMQSVTGLFRKNKK